MNRTTFVTVASVGGVLIAGAAVIGANFGILNAADASAPLGDLSAAVEPSAFATTTTSTAPQDAVLAFYQIEDAGTVEVLEAGDGLAFGLVESATGWVWVPESEGEALRGTFSNGATNIQFHAIQADGSIQAEIVAVGADGSVGPGSSIASSQPVPVPAQTSPTTAPLSYDDDYDDDYDYDYDDDHDYDDDYDDDHDDDHDDDTHEGRDDDD